MKALWLAWRETARIVSSQRKLWLPFLVVALVEVCFLGLVWLAPHPPFSALLAPPLRQFFGDRVLHYPAHLWFLYHVMSHAHLAASVLVGAFMSGIACAFVRQGHEGKPFVLRDVLVGKQVRYGRVLLLWLISWGVAKGLMGVALPTAPQTALALWRGIGLAVLLQSLFVYAIPAAVFEGSAWWRALGQGFRETIRYPLSTLFVVALPSLAVIAFSLAASETWLAQVMIRTTPEMAILLVVARLAVWTVADACMTIAIAHLWWFHRTPGAARPAPASPAPRVSARRARPAAVRTPALAGRTLAASLVVGIILPMALILSGCSRSYSGERLYWKAERLNARIMANPNTASPEQFAEATEILNRVIREAGGTVWAARAQGIIGSLHALQRDYPAARAAYTLVMENHHQHGGLVLQARLATAETYRLEQDWDGAVRIYDEIADQHPWSRTGLTAPLYVAAGFQLRGHPDEAARAYERAVGRYAELVERAPTPELQASVKGYLAQVYYKLGRWDGAIETLEELRDAPSHANRPLTLFLLGSLYQAKRGDMEKAREAFTTLVSEFPDDQYGGMAKARLEQLGLPAASHVSVPDAAQAGLDPVPGSSSLALVTE